MPFTPVTVTRTGSLVQQYIVQPSDTLLSIASQFQIPLFQLMSLNGIDDPDGITAGQTLILRKGISTSARAGE